MTTIPTKAPDNGLRLQKRDLKLLEDLFECRLLTIRHAAELYFSGSYGGAKRRMRELREAGLLKMRDRGINEPAVFFFTRRAFDELRRRGMIPEFAQWDWSRVLQKRADVSERTILHELSVMDVKTALQSEIQRQAHLRVIVFGTWPALHEFRARRTQFDPQGNATIKVIPTKPDGFLRVREHAPLGGVFEHDLFLEVDLGNEVRSILVSKASAYQDYYRSGGYAHRRGGPSARREDYPFRVLMVMRNAEQRNNVCERLLYARVGATQVWTATLPDVGSQPLGRIWIRPLDYRRAIAGGPFDLRQVRPKTYIRRPEREEWIERRVIRHGLLDDPGLIPSGGAGGPSEPVV